MFSNIMIMVDNSAVMQDMLHYVTALFPESYYHLYSIVNLGSFSGYYTKVVQNEMRKMGSETLKNLSRIFESMNLKFSSYLDEGEPVSSSLSYAKKNGVDLFVFNTHAGLSSNKIKLGTTTAAIIAYSHIPLFLLGEELLPSKKPRILHPTTGSKYSEKATLVAGELTKALDGTLETLILKENDLEIKNNVIDIIDRIGVNNEFSKGEKGEVASIIAHAKNADIIVGSRGSPRPSYKLRFFMHTLAIDPSVRLLVAFLPKPFLMVCD
jgi:nucleotide-binding universal stress UspA family protein